MQLSERLKGLVQSDIRRMSRECERVGGINLGQGICDLPTHPLVAQGAIEAIEDNRATYTKFEGIDILREKIARKIEHYNHYRVDPGTQVVVTVGSTGGFAAAVLATLNPGDEVILFEPYYGYHLNTLRVFGVQTKLVTLQPPDWEIDFSALERAFTPRTRGIVICTPSNPSGKVFTRSELQRIGDLCRKHSSWIFTDEIYEYILFDGREHVSPASMENSGDRVITISGFSKTFSITGWRIGYVTAAPEVARAIGLINDLIAVCAPAPLQWGVARGLDVEDSYYTDLARDYEKKRDMTAEALREAGFTPYPPQGSYYMLADFSKLGFTNDKEAASLLLEETRVASVPGSAFYESDAGSRMLRFCFAKDFAALEEACRRLRSFRPATANRR